MKSGSSLWTRALIRLDGRGADAVGLGIGGGDLLAVEAALARVDLQVADIQAHAGKAHHFAAVDELPGNVLLHGGQGVVQAGLEEDVVVGRWGSKLASSLRRYISRPSIS